MSPDEPIELPGLSAQRRGPSAAVCVSGHLFAWFVEPGDVPAFCPKCGEAVLVACPECKLVLPPDPDMLSWVPYHMNCRHCGKPYPWKAADLARAKRTIAEQAEVEKWDEAVRARADELVDDIAAERATGSSVVAAVNWLELNGAGSATATILDAVERLASMSLKQALRPSFPGLF